MTRRASYICEFCKETFVVPSLAADCELGHLAKEFDENDQGDVESGP